MSRRALGFLAIACGVLVPAGLPAEPTETPSNAWGDVGIRALADVTAFGTPLVCPGRPSEPVLEVVGLAEGSPAIRAGMRLHDLIVRWGGSPVPSPEEAGRRLLSLRPGARIDMAVARTGAENPLVLVAEPGSLALLARERIEAAALWLCSKQLRPGAWTYSTPEGAKAHSAPLTALALYGLSTVPRPALRPEHEEALRRAIARGAEYLRGRQAEDGGVDQFGNVGYRNFTTAFTVLALQRVDPEGARDQIRKFRDFLVRSQISVMPAFVDSYPSLGGWNYHDKLDPRTLKVEITITAWVLNALAATRGLPSDELAACFQRAEQFASLCQNVPRSGVAPQPAWEDGGFHTHPEESKAGSNEVELDDIRYRSYGSTTADGLRALLYVGRPLTDPRVQAALAWISRNFSVERNPGFPAAAPVPFDQGIYYYYVLSLTQGLDAAGVAMLPPATEGGAPRDWAAEVARELLARQRFHGAWKNRVPIMSEDDPVIATSMALIALDTALAHLR